MKLWKYVGLVAATAFFTVGCKSPVYTEKAVGVNLNNYHTYMWVDAHKTQDGNAERPVAYADVSVRNAANAELNKIGWREVGANPDVLISYDVLVERNVSQENNPVYSQPFTRWYFNPYTRRWHSFYYPSQFLGYQTYEVPVRDGTITITMIDSRDDKVVWQGWTTEQLNYSRLTSDEINKSVRNIFSKFDVAMR